MMLGCAAATQARAQSSSSWFQFEAGLGVTSAQKIGDGTWYQRGFSHDTPNASYGGRIGVQMNLADPDHWKPGWHLHLDYLNFGKVRWTSTDAEDPNPQGTMGYNAATLACNDGNCGTLRRFDSTGGIQAIALTIEPYWSLGSGWTAGLEAGPALFRSTWTSIATSLGDGNAAFGPAGTQQTFARRPRTQLGWIAGVGVGKGPFTVRVNYLRAPIDTATDGMLSGGGTGQGGGQWVPSGMDGEWMLSLNYTF